MSYPTVEDKCEWLESHDSLVARTARADAFMTAAKIAKHNGDYTTALAILALITNKP